MSGETWKAKENKHVHNFGSHNWSLSIERRAPQRGALVVTRSGCGGGAAGGVAPRCAPTATRCAPIARNGCAMGSQRVRNASSEGSVGGAARNAPTSRPPTARGAAGGAARAEPGVAEAPRPGTAPPIYSARSPTATCASQRSQRRPLAMAEQPAAPRRLPTSRYRKAWSLWPLRCAGDDDERPYDGAPHRSKLEMQAC